ncbi:MAG: hypothetical protein EBQ96_06970 [Proteobacteria bacterium]|nr:hypothetical protein [Pseudomonadota bacterium]
MVVGFAGVTLLPLAIYFAFLALSSPDKERDQTPTAEVTASNSLPALAKGQAAVIKAKQNLQ